MSGWRPEHIEESEICREGITMRCPVCKGLHRHEPVGCIRLAERYGGWRWVEMMVWVERCWRKSRYEVER